MAGLRGGSAIGALESRWGRQWARWLTEATAAAGRRRVEAELRGADTQVKAHEKTHLAVAGPYAEGPASYIYVRGPNGELYAVGGSVKVDLRPVPGNPEATLRKAKALMRAAVSPGNPSAADMRVAAEAYRLAAQARREIEAGTDERPGQSLNILV